jgi:hypothetical protein
MTLLEDLEKEAEEVEIKALNSIDPSTDKGVKPPQIDPENPDVLFVPVKMRMFTEGFVA